MIERKHRFGNLVFDRNAIVRAALSAYVEDIFTRAPGRCLPLSFSICANSHWTGDLQRGAFRNEDGCGSHNVVAWTEAGVVGLAYELGFGPLDWLGLPTDAITGGPDDVRGALPGLPAELKPAFEMAVEVLFVGSSGEKLAGIGFWLYDNRVAGTLFDDPIGPGAHQLARWGLLQGGRLAPSIAFSSHPSNQTAVAEGARRAAPTHAILDPVVDRRFAGPTEFTTEEIAMLFHSPTDPKELLPTQRRLAKVGITWPGSPELPPKDPLPWPRINPFTGKPLTEAEVAEIERLTS